MKQNSQEIQQYEIKTSTLYTKELVTDLAYNLEANQLKVTLEKDLHSIKLN